MSHISQSYNILITFKIMLRIPLMWTPLFYRWLWKNDVADLKYLGLVGLFWNIAIISYCIHLWCTTFGKVAGDFFFFNKDSNNSLSRPLRKEKLPYPESGWQSKHKASCKVNWKQCYSQGHTKAVKCHNKPPFEWLLFSWWETLF